MKNLQINLQKTSLEWWKKLSDVQQRDYCLKYGYIFSEVESWMILLIYRKEKSDTI